MKTKTPTKTKKSNLPVNLSDNRTLTTTAGQVKIKYLSKAHKFSEARKREKIHPRKILPKVKAGIKIADSFPTRALSMDMQKPVAAFANAKTLALTPTDTLKLVKNVKLKDVATSDTASHVCEPSAAINGNVVFYTGNWFAAISKNGGTTFSYIDPYHTFPDPPGMEFCCDQVVHYIKSIDTFIWLLQYGTDASGKNILRIAYAKTASAIAGNWKYFDVSPSMLGFGGGIWFDFPDLADGKNNLYMTTNCFAGENWRASVVLRIKLSSFTDEVLKASKYVSNSVFSLRVAQNCGTTAYFVGHKDTSVLSVFAWKESNAAPTVKSISVATWEENNYSSTVPDGKDWLQRADSRHTGATLAGNEFWCAWGSASGGANNRPCPFIQIARINVNTMTLIENINLWNPDYAFFYAALSTNSNNEVGAAYTIGGATKFPTHVISILTGTRRHSTTFSSTRGPSDNKWGDYLAVRRNYSNQKLFCATGYSLQDGAGSSDATPNFTIFGRASEV